MSHHFQHGGIEKVGTVRGVDAFDIDDAIEFAHLAAFGRAIRLEIVADTHFLA